MLHGSSIEYIVITFPENQFLAACEQRFDHTGPEKKVCQFDEKGLSYI